MAETVLVTGARGTLGRPLVNRLRSAGWNVREGGRGGPVRLDLATGEGLSDAVAGADVVVHAATSVLKDTWTVDVEGTGLLLERARDAGVRHFVYIGIVGTDRSQRAPYFRAKLAAEEAVRTAAVPWTIQRATPFFELFVDVFFPRMTIAGILLTFRGVRYQPVDVGEVARRLAEIAGGSPRGLAADFGGPEILTLEQLARTWVKAARLRRRVLSLPLLAGHPRQLAEARVTPGHREGKVTWADWLRQRYGPPSEAG